MATKKEEVVNPFTQDISYSDLLKQIPEGVSLENHFKDVISEDEIKRLKSELKYYNQNLENQKAEEPKQESKFKLENNGNNVQ